ncbi:MAG: glycyl-tRNA synthetase subunit beta [Candidatus Bathyarchaeota archaeon B26-2]|nr:MAG: glycyl-tRNA synthetase subunit beta [Candidatus Bathyarchaeota archaeon B26-2]
MVICSWGRDMKPSDKYELVSELARRRGFFWPACEIYGGVSGFMAFGPLGTILKRKIEDKFRDLFLRRLGLYEIESPVIVPGRVFKASGHVEHFKEPMVGCTRCNRRFRADHLLQEFAGISSTEAEKMSLREIGEAIESRNIKCPECGGNLTEPRYFLTMFQTTIGPYAEAVGYGRPEAAQGIFVEFKRLYEQARGRLPMGVAQIGHALRNEISPRQGPIRLREFTIIDLEFFFDPERPECPLIGEVEDEVLRLIPAEVRLKDSEEPVEITVKEALEKGYIKMEWLAFFMALAKRFLVELGVPEDRQRFIEKLKWERAHYSVQGFDQEVYLDRWGWTEVSGHNYRTDFDLKSHMEESGVDMRVFKEDGRVVERVEISARPRMDKIGRAFKEETPKVVSLISKVDPEELEEALKEKGFYTLKGYKILPDHVEIVRRRHVERGRRFIPHVIEPSFGSDRLVYVLLEYAYTKRDTRTILKIPRDLAPIEVAVLPLVSRDGLPEKAQEVHRMLLDEGFLVEYDESGSIGRRYARFDEVGTPICITVDYQTLEDETVTLRDRDTWRQVRTEVRRLPQLLTEYLHWKRGFEDLGTPTEGC